MNNTELGIDKKDIAYVAAPRKANNMLSQQAQTPERITSSRRQEAKNSCKLLSQSEAMGLH
jgi:hypothetical protein